MKRMFGKKKEMTPEQNRQQMMDSGIQVSQGGWRQPKFNNFSDHAKNLAANKNQPYAPNAPPAAPSAQTSNPYAAAGAQLNYTPSSASSRPPTYQSNYSNGYGDNSHGGGGNGYSNQPAPSTASPYATAQKSYQTRFGSQSQPNLERQQSTDTFDNSRNALFSGAKTQNQGLPGRTAMASYGSQSALQNTNISAEDELNMTPAELDAARGQGYMAGASESQLDSEDEDVETIKGQIRFTKQESVQSTRRALQIAADAEESGRNTLGMLGSQGERLANTEHNLAIASTQNKIAEEKARELKTLNRSMFAVHVPNPFGAKRRLQEKEDRLKSDKRMEQEMRESRRQMAYDSQQRVQNGLQPKSEMAQKYKQKTGERKKYQFEEDSEDEAMEDEIDANLDGIASATQRLKRLAQATNEEVTRQNDRLDHIANSTDTLDVNVHLNTNRLANIR